jgi:hypothetical protein
MLFTFLISLDLPCAENKVVEIISPVSERPQFVYTSAHEALQLRVSFCEAAYGGGLKDMLSRRCISHPNPA